MVIYTVTIYWDSCELSVYVLIHAIQSYCINVFTYCYYLPAITVIFSQTTYSVDEDDGPAQPMLVLSNPLTTAITVQVTNTDGSATGEYCSILINY